MLGVVDEVGQARAIKGCWCSRCSVNTINSEFADVLDRRKENAYPVLLRVVLDGTVRAELAHLGRRADTLLDPLGAVLVRLIDKRECLNVCGAKTA